MSQKKKSLGNEWIWAALAALALAASTQIPVISQAIQSCGACK